MIIDYLLTTRLFTVLTEWYVYKIVVMPFMASEIYGAINRTTTKAEMKPPEPLGDLCRSI
jgi:hypothetical protein